jgi:NADPH:quinone reductase
MRGWITDPSSEGGLRLTDDLPEPEARANELIVEVKAYSINRGELTLIRTRSDGWRPGQDLSGVVSRAAAEGAALRDRQVRGKAVLTTH